MRMMSMPSNSGTCRWTGRAHARAAHAPVLADEAPAYLDTRLSFEAARRRSGVAHDAGRKGGADAERPRRPIPRLGVPPTTGGTRRCTASRARAARPCFRRPSALAATFDMPTDGRGRHAPSATRRAPSTISVRAEGQHGRYQGLTFWSPNINIFRDPRWGRGQETYGEDPVPHRAHGRRLRARPAGRRSGVPQARRHRQALRRAQRPRSRAPSLRRPSRASATSTKPICRRSRRW